jgi:hypothetical protein
MEMVDLGGGFRLRPDEPKEKEEDGEGDCPDQQLVWRGRAAVAAGALNGAAYETC